MKVQILVNGAMFSSIDTTNAVAADYISFMESLTHALMDTEALEREANTSGKTILHPHFATFGSATISDSKDP